jgi:hypothetical protein
MRAMGVAEISARVKQLIQSQLESHGVGRLRPARPLGEPGRAWVSPISTRFDRARYCSGADAIVAGRFRVFALGSAHLGFPPDWNRDPKTGVSGPASFGKFIDYRDERRVGDIKFLWEPNRHCELVTIAQAWHLSQDPRYLQACATLLDSWLVACPYPQGANWSSSLELGLRLVNWAFAWHLLGGDSSPAFAGDGGQALRLRWLLAVRQHCHFIAGYLSRHSSANNHLLGELLGLFVGSTTWPLWRESRSWQQLARREFELEALRQNSPDGVNREQALWYHHEVADMMLIALLFARNNGCDFGSEFVDRWSAMLQFIASVMDVNGNVPKIGDADDAVIARLDPRDDFCPYRSLLASGAVLLKREDLKIKARNFDDKNRWLLGDNAEHEYACLAQADLSADRLPIRRAFSDGGYFVLGSDFETPTEVRIIADAGPLGYLSIAAHGHADALAFTLSVAGVPFLVDPGTYAYHTNERWRRYFRGTPAHNTVTVDDEDQSVAGGNFLWTQHALVRATKFESSIDADCLVAEHDGYCRLADPLVHRREIRYFKRSRSVRVTDQLLCKAPHRIEINWHFAPACLVELNGLQARATQGAIAVELTWPAGLSARLARGEEIPPRGWYSPHFDVKEPCTTLVLQGEIDGAWEGAVRIRILAAGESATPAAGTHPSDDTG